MSEINKTTKNTKNTETTKNTKIPTPNLSTLIKPHILTEIYRRGWAGACENLSESDQNEIAKALVAKLPNEFLADLVGLVSTEDAVVLSNYQKVEKTSVLSLVINSEGDRAQASSVSEKIGASFSGKSTSESTFSKNIKKRYVMAEDDCEET